MITATGIGQTGIGLRAPHVAEVLLRRPAAGFLEVHTENYFGGGMKLRHLETLRRDYALSLHGVGLSLGRADGLDEDHLGRVAALVRRFEPDLVSEHLSWSAFGHSATPDLLPVPLTHEALDICAAHVARFQDAVGRAVLIETPSTYVALDGDYDEPEFLLRLSARTGCKLLIDLNNIHVSAKNCGRDALAYLKGLRDGAAIGEYHLAGHDDIGGLLVDTHGKPVPDPVWALYDEALARFGDRPTLIEWDSDIPPLDRLLAEAATADARRAMAVGSVSRV
jgi:uncharacterized protein (UPF0276 family)